jgi:hypothetical protein
MFREPERGGCGESDPTDVHIIGELGGIEQWRTVERVPRDPEDRGDVSMQLACGFGTSACAMA